MVIKYEDTKIYKIYSHVGDKIYIGSTTKQLLSQRMAKHRDGYKIWKSGGKGGFIRSYELFDEYGIENCIIELIEAKPCMDSDEKNKLEGKYIRELNCVNKMMAGRTKKEYYEDNKEKIKDKSKQHYEDNKEIIKEYSKTKYENNKELILGRNKIYRNINATKIKEHKGESKICECGLSYTHHHKARHLRTLKHKKYLETC